MYDETHFSRDAATVEFDTSVEGITTDDDGETMFDWDSVERITVDDPPYTSAFDSKEFYKIPATVAKPIPQPYQFGEDAVWLKKPREELKKAAWSLDNAPWTHGHPETGMVKDVSDVRGFWGSPRYHDGLDDLDADLHIPVDEKESKEYLESNDDVSVGFYNRIERTDDYDGVIGGEDDSNVDIDGYQTNMLFDHVASVEVGRCAGSQGCGIDAAHHGHASVVDEDSFIRGTVPKDISDDAGGDDSAETDSPHMCENGDPDDPCGSQDCDRCSNDTTETNSMDISFDDLSAEAALSKLESKNDGAKDRLDELRSYQDEADAAEEAADELDRDVSELADAVAMLSDQKEDLESEVDNLQDTVSDLRRPEMEEDAEYIAEHTDRFGDDAEEVIDELDEDAEEISDKRDFVEDFVDSTQDVTANAGGDGGSDPTETTDSGRYATTPWE